MHHYRGGPTSRLVECCPPFVFGGASDAFEAQCLLCAFKSFEFAVVFSVVCSHSDVTWCFIQGSISEIKLRDQTDRSTHVHCTRSQCGARSGWSDESFAFGVCWSTVTSLGLIVKRNPGKAQGPSYSTKWIWKLYKQLWDFVEGRLVCSASARLWKFAIL